MIILAMAQRRSHAPRARGRSAAPPLVLPLLLSSPHRCAIQATSTPTQAPEEAHTFTGTGGGRTLPPDYPSGPTPPPLPDGCAQGWDYFSPTGKCYKLICETVDWYDARADCMRYGGTLADAKTPEENTFVTTIVGVAGPVWIGLSETGMHLKGIGANPWDAATGDGKWRWESDGSVKQWENWKCYNGWGCEPNDHDGLDEECAALGRCPGSDKWVDTHCYHSLIPYVCMASPGDTVYDPRDHDCHLTGKHVEEKTNIAEGLGGRGCDIPFPWSMGPVGTLIWHLFWFIFLCCVCVCCSFYCCCHNRSLKCCPPKFVGCCTGGWCCYAKHHPEWNGLVAGQGVPSGAGAPPYQQGVQPYQRMDAEQPQVTPGASAGSEPPLAQPSPTAGQGTNPLQQQDGKGAGAKGGKGGKGGKGPKEGPNPTMANDAVIQKDDGKEGGTGKAAQKEKDDGKEGSAGKAAQKEQDDGKDAGKTGKSEKKPGRKTPPKEREPTSSGPEKGDGRKADDGGDGKKPSSKKGGPKSATKAAPKPAPKADPKAAPKSGAKGS